MNWLIGILCLFFLGLALAILMLVRRLQARVGILEIAAELELTTACKVKPAAYLAQRLSDLVDRDTKPFLVGAIQPADSLVAVRDLATLLRKVAIQGVDEIFLDGGRFWLVVHGQLDPFRVGRYFQKEVAAHCLSARCSWAYTASPDRSVRSQVKEKAVDGLGAPITTSQVVAVLPEGAESLGCEPGKISDENFQLRREATGLSRAEFAAAVGYPVDSLVEWETGRCCHREIADDLAMKLSLIEKVWRAQRPGETGQ